MYKTITCIAGDLEAELNTASSLGYKLVSHQVEQAADFGYTPLHVVIMERRL